MRCLPAVPASVGAGTKETPPSFPTAAGALSRLAVIRWPAIAWEIGAGATPTIDPNMVGGGGGLLFFGGRDGVGGGGGGGGAPNSCQRVSTTPAIMGLGPWPG